VAECLAADGASIVVNYNRSSDEARSVAAGILAMDEGRPSVTAEDAAVMRTIHRTLDGEPKILVDRLVLASSLRRVISISRGSNQPPTRSQNRLSFS